MLLYSLLGLCIFAAGGAPLLALLGERLAIARKRVFLDKLGGQLIAMAGILALCTIPFTLGTWFMSWAGGWVALYLKQPDLPLPAFSLELAGPLNLLCGGLYALALIFLLLYWLTWKPMRKHKGTHSFLGVLTVFFCLLALLVILAAKRTGLNNPELFSADLSPEAFVASFSNLTLTSPFLPLVAECLAMCVAAGAGIGLFYLLIRRNKEDFGRDYYNFALKKAASWALVSGSLCLFLGGWLAFVLLPELRMLQFQQPKVIYFATGLLCQVLACLCWGLVQAGATPLRNKPSVVLGACFMWLSLHFQGMGVYLTVLT